MMDFKSGKALLQFSAAWCGPCQTIKPIAEEIARMNGVQYAYLDIEKHEDLATHFGVRGLPTFIALHDGQEVARQQGGTTGNALRQLMRAFT